MELPSITDEQHVRYWARTAHTFAASFTKAIGRFRIETGATLDDVVARMGKDRAYLTRLLKGDKNPTLKTMAAAALAVDCDLIINLEPRDSQSNSRPKISVKRLDNRASEAQHTKSVGITQMLPTPARVIA